MTAALQHILDIPGKSILFAGVGNVLKQDDGAGVFIARGIRKGNGISTLVVEMGIENHIGKINTLAPDILVIIDATDFGEKPGFIRLAEVSSLKGITTNTHNISLAKISELFNMPVYILGIQPADISFGEGMSPEIRESADRIVKLINSKNGELIFAQ
ncbi:MAG: hydrogenase maturation protease [Bacteroidales bacterium]